MSVTSGGRVLVLGDDTRSFLTVVRSLGRFGLEVHVAWCPLNFPVLRSRYIAAIHRLPEYRPEGAEWLEALAALLRQTHFDLVIPCHDSGLLPLHEQRARLEPLAPLALPGAEAFDVFFSKRRTYEVAAELQIALPRQRIVRSLEEAKSAAADFGLPLVLKPQSSARIDDPWSRQTVVKIRDRAALEGLAGNRNFDPGFLAQENFCGAGVGVEVLCREGEILTAFQHLRVHEPLHGGGSSYRRSVPLHPALLEATRKLLRATRYTGVAMAEYKMNLETGKWILIEVNPRFWGSLPLSVAAGLDFPRYLYEMSCRGRATFPQTYRYDLYARNWLADLYWFKANLESDRGDPTLMTLPLPRVAREAWHVLALRDRSDTLTLDDPAPGMAELWQFAAAFGGARLERSGWWRGRMARRAAIAVHGARRILFLCHGNICRSPFAEAALRRAGGGREYRSAGYHPVEGRPSPEAAVRAAAGLGIELGAHRSRIWSAEEIAWADLVFIFERRQRERLAAVYPEALAKTHYLGALDPAGPLQIEDPYGHDGARFEAVYREILRLLDAAALRA